MRIYLTRHGQTDWNIYKKMQGKVDNKMNETGIHQVEAVKEGLKNVRFDCVYSSPLQRARQTAEIIVGDKERVIIDDRVCEIDFGELEGAVYKEEFLNPDAPFTGRSKTIRDFFYAPDKYVPLERGETYEELFSRLRDFLNFLKDKYTNKENILVVSHATCIHVILEMLLGIPLEKLWEIRVPNCSVSIIEYDSEYKVIESAKRY